VAIAASIWRRNAGQDGNRSAEPVDFSGLSIRPEAPFQPRNAGFQSEKMPILGPDRALLPFGGLLTPRNIEENCFLST
jgi:hypothetical protein